MSIVESISCGFDIIQSPDPKHLRIKIEAVLPDSHLDDYMLALKLGPNTPAEEAKKLENMLNEHVEKLWVLKKTSKLEQ